MTAWRSARCTTALMTDQTVASARRIHAEASRRGGAAPAPPAPAGVGPAPFSVRSTCLRRRRLGGGYSRPRPVVVAGRHGERRPGCKARVVSRTGGGLLTWHDETGAPVDAAFWRRAGRGRRGGVGCRPRG